MKREILFRGKRVDNGEWVEGYLVIALNGANLIYVNYDIKQTTEINGKPFYSVYAKNYDVIPESIGQYTGLKDKNGKKIFEGDILLDNAIVKWFDDLFWDGGGSNHPGFYCKEWFEYGDFEYADMRYHKRLDSDCEVIGNIHDNPELLETK